MISALIRQAVSNLRYRREEGKEEGENNRARRGDKRYGAPTYYVVVVVVVVVRARGFGHETTLREIYCIRGSRQPRVERASVGSNDTE